ncbi:hypothetical protein [Cohnella nanjingensis]|uniref:Integral membrane protein n=1 Tax=Cohnella nanjingensis TaxID=1387779 RepID=A0A7X0VFK6_9BACL|nr:hypothetical protein [Cohnella nanjingensis]MBB6672142.1 hypothetical protein [Cohnella nanjingensis]
MGTAFSFLQAAAYVSAILLVGIAGFQVMLLLGLPLGAYSWGGKHPGVLPKRLRLLSLPAACVLLLIGFIFLVHTDAVAIDMPSAFTRILVWIFTIFLGLNTLGNLASKSRQEKRAMAPLSGILFVCGLYIALYGG